jgi:tRNA-dihydrouridine synthase
MLLDADRAVAVLKGVRDALPPVAITTVSLRRGFDDSPESRERFDRIIQSAWDQGYAAARVHARTVQQKYHGPAHWPSLVEVKRRYADHVILGSGDVFTAQDVVRMLDETAVNVVWIARGAIGNPWIFRDAASLLADRAAVIEPPRIHEQRDALAEHFAIAMQIHGEQLAGRRMRKMGIKYARFHPAHRQVKEQFIAVRSLRDWTAVLDRWYVHDAPGIWPDARAADEVNDPSQLDQDCQAA